MLLAIYQVATQEGKFTFSRRSSRGGKRVGHITVAEGFYDEINGDIVNIFPKNLKNDGVYFTCQEIMENKHIEGSFGSAFENCDYEPICIAQAIEILTVYNSWMCATQGTAQLNRSMRQLEVQSGEIDADEDDSGYTPLGSAASFAISHTIKTVSKLLNPENSRTLIEDKSFKFSAKERIELLVEMGALDINIAVGTCIQLFFECVRNEKFHHVWANYKIHGYISDINVSEADAAKSLKMFRQLIKRSCVDKFETQFEDGNFYATLPVENQHFDVQDDQ